MATTTIIPPPWLQPKPEPAKPDNVVTEEPAQETPKRKSNSRWHKGMKSPNPHGRKKGISDRRLVLKAEIAERGKQILDVLYEKAMDGDVQACGIILDRCVPRLKPQSKMIQFELTPESSMTERADQVLFGIANGQIDPDTGNSLINSMAAVHNLRQIDELAERIAKLEGK